MILEAIFYVSGIYDCCLMIDDWDLGETEREMGVSLLLLLFLFSDSARGNFEAIY